MKKGVRWLEVTLQTCNESSSVDSMQVLVDYKDIVTGGVGIKGMGWKKRDGWKKGDGLEEKGWGRKGMGPPAS